MSHERAFGVIEKHLGDGRFRIRVSSNITIEAQVLAKPGVPDRFGVAYSAETINGVASSLIGREVLAMVVIE